MDPLNETGIIRRLLRPYAAIRYAYGDIHNKTVFDDENGRYLVMSQGWRASQRVHGCLIHVEILGDENLGPARRDGGRHRRRAGGRRHPSEPHRPWFLGPGGAQARRARRRVVGPARRPALPLGRAAPGVRGTRGSGRRRLRRASRRGVGRLRDGDEHRDAPGGLLAVADLGEAHADLVPEARPLNRRDRPFPGRDVHGPALRIRGRLGDEAPARPAGHGDLRRARASSRSSPSGPAGPAARWTARRRGPKTRAP